MSAARGLTTAADKHTCRDCRRDVRECQPGYKYRLTRGFCKACYQRALASGLERVGRGPGGSNREPPPPPEPTDAMPGTERKVAVLASRAAAGFHLYHPRDAMDRSGWRMLG